MRGFVERRCCRRHFRSIYASLVKEGLGAGKAENAKMPDVLPLETLPEPREVAIFAINLSSHTIS
jgi:hypothetical protein